MGRTESKLHIDWPTVRDRIDLTAVATALLGPPVKRIGSRLAWLCPFHDDHDPSFTVDAKGWRCWPCGFGGDAAELVMRHERIGFPEAMRRLADMVGIAAPSIASGRPNRPGRTTHRRNRACPPVRPVGPSPVATVGRPPGKAPGGPPDRPSGLPSADALALVEAAAVRLWTPEGRAARDYLFGRRGLTEATIRRHRLGWTPGVLVPGREGASFRRVAGITIPWEEGDTLQKVKIRRLTEDKARRYDQVFSDNPRVYPSMAAIRPGTPLVIVEGEFEAMLLGQALAGLASVITTGSASSGIDPALLSAMLRCPRWYAAHDADSKGGAAAEKCYARAVRVRPPIEPPAGKDWGDARQAGIDLRGWWLENVLADAFDREERAAIVEFDGGLSREAAEDRAGLPGIESSTPA